MTTISIKSQIILSKLGISLYKQRKNHNQSFSDEIIFHKRDDILALLPKKLSSHTTNQINLFTSIMQTMTSNDPIIVESIEKYTSNVQINAYCKQHNQLSSIKTIISFGVQIDKPENLIQAPLLEELINDPSLKRPLWEDIKKYTSK